MKIKLQKSIYPILFIALIVASCSPEDGVDGVDGAQGEQGPTGQNGADGQDGVDGEDAFPNTIFSNWFPTEIGDEEERSTNFSILIPAEHEEIFRSSTEGGIVLVYGRVVNERLTDTFQLPFIFRNIVKNDFSTVVFSSEEAQSRLLIYASTLDNSRRKLNFIQEYRYVLIPPPNSPSQKNSGKRTIAAQLISAGIDVSSYNQLATYFNIKY
ncbi:collagen-like protein [Costertonia aggregata]|uniref:Collagen-like protein n=1 Tax=Costertonia aggregata TaxID=343403 RepID=A0A7H9ANA0_9FLAO|nr:collagen-like protein [Costertonia aggregata]QLG44932.1 collagen-like protein [Costertonia aggregata]